MVMYEIFKMAPTYSFNRCEDLLSSGGSRIFRPGGGGQLRRGTKIAKNCIKWNKFDRERPLDSPLMSEHVFSFSPLTTSRSVTFRYVFLSVASVNTQGLWVSWGGLHFVSGASFTSPCLLVVTLTVVISCGYLSVVFPPTTHWNLNVTYRNKVNKPTIMTYSRGCKTFSLLIN